MADVFVSYARADQERVRPIVDALQNAGVSVWWDRSLEPGSSWADVIDRELRRAACVVVIWSHTSVASRWVSIEAHEARRRGVLIPVRLDPVALDEEFAGIQRLDWFAGGDATRLLLERVTSLTGRGRRLRRGVVAAAIAVLLAVAAVFLIDRSPPPADQPGGPGDRSIAVLPFRADGSAPPGLASGLAQGVAEELARVTGLRVTDYEAAAAAAGESLERIRERLEVAWLLRGLLRVSSSGILAEVTLQDPVSGAPYRTWSFSRSETQLAELSREIAVAAIEVLPLQDPHLAPARFADVDGDAYRLYLQGQSLLREGRDTEARIRAENFLRDSIARAPEFAAAHAGLCSAEVWSYEAALDPADLEQAEARCAMALELGAGEPEVERAQAELEAARGDHASAVRRLRALLEVEPGDNDARRLLAVSLGQLGEMEAAAEAFRRAIAEQPGHWAIRTAYADFLISLGEHEAAAREAVRALDLAPPQPSALSNLGVALLLAGRMESAIDAFRRSLELSETSPALSNLGTAYYYGGRLEEAVEVFERAVALAPRDFRLWSNLADARFAAGRDDAAAAWREAERLAAQSLEQLDADPAARLGMEAFRAALGRSSFDAIEAAIAQAPDTWETDYWAAMAFARIEEPERARGHLLDAIDGGLPEVLARRDPVIGDLIIGEDGPVVAID